MHADVYSIKKNMRKKNKQISVQIYIYTHRHPGVDRIWTFQKTQVNFLSSTLDFLVQDDNIYIHKQAISHSKNHTRVARKPQPLSNLK